tara:strand:- start:563 stop:1519 length:957 start_codon:yes stop_codon:yes gene_type:complete
MEETLLPESEVAGLREKYYNATVTEIIVQHDTLACFRIKPDFSFPEFESGQYTTLGLGYWESRRKDAIPEIGLAEKKLSRLVRRAYSVSHPITDSSENLFESKKIDFLEFYIVMVIGNDDEEAPALTPRLFMLKKGDRLHLGEKFTGDYTIGCMEEITQKNDSLVVFAGTGTGEGPHNHMIWNLLQQGYKGQIASINCVRYKKDLAYEQKYRDLEKKYPNLSYHTLTTRESDTLHDKTYIQDYILSGNFEQKIGRKMHPEDTHIFLCGNPSMIGIPKIRDGKRIWPEGQKGVIQIMEERGFKMDYAKRKGNIHYEKYW